MNHKEILLIEDNDTDAELAIRALKENNTVGKITHKSSGVEALHYLFSGEEMTATSILPSLILLDLKLPKLDGLEVLKAIRHNTTTKCIPVIMLSSSKELPDVHVAYSLGANSYIVKPVEYEKFSEAMKAVAHYWMWVNQSPPLK